MAAVLAIGLTIALTLHPSTLASGPRREFRLRFGTACPAPECHCFATMMSATLSDDEVTEALSAGTIPASATGKAETAKRECPFQQKRVGGPGTLALWLFYQARSR